MKILIVVAHADDETIAASSLMFRQPQDVMILHTTDSAPRNPKYFTRAGYSTREAYGANRRAEFLAAMEVVGIRAGQCRMLPIPDQDAIINLAGLVEAIRAQLPVDRIITHAYEGGHPDHDATALAVSLAVAGTPARVLEYPGYHAFGGAMVASVFLPHPSNPPVEHVVLTPEDIARKLAMFDCFASQRHVFDRFSTTEEQFRPAPQYNFLEPPHEGGLYYESRDMGINYAEWRKLARAQVALQS